MTNIKKLDAKALQKVFKNAFWLVYNSRSKIITDGFFVVKNYSCVEFTTDILSALFPKIEVIRECKNFNSLLHKPEGQCYEKTCIIVEVENEKKKGRIYKSVDSDNIIVIDEKYEQYFPVYLYAHKNLCFNEETRENSNFMVMGLPYYDTLTEAMENTFLKS